MKRFLSIVIIISMLVGAMFIITGCNNKIELKESEKNIDRVNIENKLKEIKADAVIVKNLPGGECINKFQYYICYDSAKVYEYEMFILCPMLDLTDQTPDHSNDIYTLKEHDISQEQVEKIKQFVAEVQKNKQTEGVSNRYSLEIGNEIYYINDLKTFSEILEEISK